MKNLVGCDYKDGICIHCKAQQEIGHICITKILRFGAAVTKHMNDGGFDVSDEVYYKRLSICQTCDQRNPEEDSCKACGCYLPLKAKWATQECPLQKWPLLELPLAPKEKRSCCN